MVEVHIVPGIPLRGSSFLVLPQSIQLIFSKVALLCVRAGYTLSLVPLTYFLLKAQPIAWISHGRMGFYSAIILKNLLARVVLS